MQGVFAHEVVACQRCKGDMRLNDSVALLLDFEGDIAAHR